MKFRSSDHTMTSVDGAVAAGSSKIAIIIGVVAMVGTVIFIIALSLGLGLGFGLTNKHSNTAPARLNPPIVPCDASAACGCATTKPLFGPRIINGETAITNSWPWLVYLTMNNGRVCTGFLISQRHVLTTGSCVAQFLNNITVNLGINNFQSIAGGINVTNSTALAVIVAGDIGVVTLGVNITYTANIRPCCLSSSPAIPFINTPGVIAGWGETSAASIGSVSPLLQQAVVQVRDTSVCGFQTNNDTLCASFGAISTCPIDSGGPLMVNNNNLWTCVGIIDGRAPGCNNPIPFTRISTYAAAITNITGILF